MKRDEDADPDDCSEQEQQRPTRRVRFMQENHRTNGDDDVVPDAITLELVNTYRDRERQLKTQVRRLQRENDDFRTQLGEYSARPEEEATVQSRKKDTTAEDLRKQLGEMRLESEAKSAKLEARLAELEESQRHKDNLASQSKEKTTENSAAAPSSSALTFLASQLTEMSKKVAQTQQENERLQQASNRMQQENGALLEMTKQLREEVANASKLIAEFERQKGAGQADRNTDRQDDIIRLKADAERNARVLEQSVAERDQQIEGMKHELDQGRERVLAQAEENKALNERLESLQAELKSFKRADIERQVKERADREREKRDTENQLATENHELLERIRVQEKDIDSLEKQLREAEDSARSVNSYKTQIETLTEEKRVLERKLHNANALLDERTARLNNLDHENRQLGTELAEVRQIEATHQRQLADMEETIAEREGDIEELRGVIASLTERNEDAEKEVHDAIERAQQECASQQEVSRMLREELSDANKRIEELEHRRASDRGSRSEDRQKIASLERDLADARRQLANNRQRLATAEHEVDEIRKKLTDRQEEVGYLSTEDPRILRGADAYKREVERLKKIPKMHRAPQSRPADETPLCPQTSAATSSSRFTPTTDVRVNPTNVNCHLCGIRKRNGFYRPCGHGGCRECLEKYLTRMKGLCVTCRAPVETAVESQN